MISTVQRTIRDGPFCWQSKPALARIEAACDQRKDKAHVLAVYLSLTLHASNRQAEEFKLAIRQIAATAGVSYRKTADLLQFLAGLGVLAMKQNRIEGTKELDNSTYTLRTVCGTSGTEDTRSGTTTETATVPRIENNLKNNPKKNHSEEGRFAPPSLDDWLLFADSISWPRTDAETAFHYYASNGWKVGRNPMRDWHASARGCKARSGGKTSPAQNTKGTALWK